MSENIYLIHPDELIEILRNAHFIKDDDREICYKAIQYCPKIAYNKKEEHKQDEKSEEYKEAIVMLATMLCDSLKKKPEEEQ